MLAKWVETILIVHEKEVDRTLATSVLTRHQYYVLETASSTEALLVAHQYQGSVQLVVSPLVMAKIGGRELARRLLSRYPTMKALFVSNYDAATVQHHRINQKFVLQHPHRQKGLVEKVREILDAV